MTGTSTDCWEDVGTSKIVISPEALRSIFVQIEADLHRSEIYRRAVAGVQKNSENSVADGFQHLVKAVGREAIRLALRQLVKQQPVQQSAQIEVAPAPQEMAEAAIDNPFDGSLVADVALPIESSVIVQAAPTTALAPVVHVVPKSKSPSPMEQQRQAAVQQIGEQLRRARQARSLSLEQLHNQTRIPMHQLKALEAGEIEYLPEDVFTRSFIRQAGNALGLNGVELAAALPVPDTAKTIVPSWMRSTEPASFLRPVHLYVGYVTLMAGAVGGLAWLTNQPLPDGALNPAPLDESDSVSQSDGRSNFTVSPSSFTQNSSIAQPDIAPPEHLPF